MDHSNIIISVIVVLCIAAGVTAYGLTNPDNVFSDLAGFTPSTDTPATSSSDLSNGGIPSSDNTNDNSNQNSNSNDKQSQTDAKNSNSGSHQSNNGNTKTATQSSGKTTTNTNGHSSSSNSGSGNGNGNNNGNSGGSNTNNGGGSGNKTNQSVNVSNITEKQAIDIANDHVEETGAYAAKALWENNTWYVYIQDSKGETVDAILIDGNGTVIGRG